jgi:hypothetical protein
MLGTDELAHSVVGSGADQRDVVNAAWAIRLHPPQVRNATKRIKAALKACQIAVNYQTKPDIFNTWKQK